MKLFTASTVLASLVASFCMTTTLATDAWADVPKPSPSVTPEVQSAPSSSASQLGEPVVPSQATVKERSQALNQQAETINQGRSVRSGQRRDPIQQVLGLPETMRILPTRSGFGFTTQF
jgi:hypothetical protein